LRGEASIFFYFLALLRQRGDGVLNTPRNLFEKHALVPARQYPFHFDALAQKDMLRCEVAVRSKWPMTMDQVSWSLCSNLGAPHFIAR